MSTPILPLAVWQSGTNQNSIPANDNALRIEALNREIISQVVTAQPASPADGDTYIIAATHTGAQWAAFTPKDIAIFKSGTWYAWAPTEGLIVNVAGSEFKFDGGLWVSVGGSSMTNPMTTTGDIIYGGTPSGGIAPPTRLGVGTNGYVLTLAAGIPTWAAATGGFSNPMTTVGDLILGGTAGAAGRLGIGGNGQVLTVTAGAVVWSTPASGGDVVGPAGAVSGRVATYNGTTGKLMQDGGVLLSALAPLASPALTGTATAVNFTYSGLCLTAASATGSAGFRLPHGVAPTTPTNGDLWTTTAGMFARINGATVGFSAGFANPMTTVGDLIVGGSAGAAGRLAAGTATFVLTSNGAGVAPTWQAVAGGGGVTGFTTSLNTASPNNTVNASVLAASGGTTNQDAVLTPKGTGALVLGPVPDGTALGGNKRGVGAVDLQINRASNSQVASGDCSIILAGLNNTASGQDSIASGNATRSTATSSASFGNTTQATGNSAIATGSNTLASGVNSLALGASSTTRGTANATAYAPGAAGTIGDRQGRRIPFQASTTDATPTEATSDGGAGSSSNRIVIPGYGPFKIRIEVVAYNAATDDCKSWEIKALAKNVTGPTSAFVGTPSVTVEFADAGASSWTCALAVSGAAILLNVTGAAASNIKWSATAYLVEATT